MLFAQAAHQSPATSGKPRYGAAVVRPSKGDAQLNTRRSGAAQRSHSIGRRLLLLAAATALLVASCARADQQQARQQPAVPPPAAGSPYVRMLDGSTDLGPAKDQQVELTVSLNKSDRPES